MPHYSDAPVRTDGLQRIAVAARGVRKELLTGPGMFSKDRLDAGTRLLLDTCVLQPGWRVHDLGCGNGVVGIIVKSSEPSCDVVCSDTSPQAIQLAKRNAHDLQLPLTVVASDGYASVEGTFDTVLLNPPYVAGRATIYRLFAEAHEHLKPGGLLQVVARHNKGGATLKEELVRLFGNCDDSRRGGGYRLYVSTRDA